MKKFIVKNCPAFKKYCTNEFKYGICQNISKCIIKQTINHCKTTLKQCNSNCGANPYAMGRSIEADNILKLFEIEEINNKKGIKND